MNETQYLDWFIQNEKEQLVERKPILLDFYKSFFDSTESAEKFIDNVYHETTIKFELQESECLPLVNNSKKIMMNNIQRFATVLDLVEGKEVIKLFFLITCIESLYNIA